MKRFGLMVVACAAVAGMIAVAPALADKPQPTGGSSPASSPKATTTSSSHDKGEPSKASGAPHKEIPKDATGMCKDDTFSTADSKQGACSGHGGVKHWYGKPAPDTTGRCKDGSFTKAQSAQGACSGHGGVAYWIKEPKGAEAKH
jgi:hypothetical protein